MKLSDLSYREYVALEILPAVLAATAAGQHNAGAGYAPSGMSVDERICSDAFRLADAFLKVAGKENDKVTSAEIRAKRSDDSLQIFRDHIKHILSDPGADDGETVVALKHMIGLPV